MLPVRANQPSLRRARCFELITPAGRVHHFPRPTLLQRLLALVWRHADTAAISAVIFASLYIAGLAAESLGPLAIDCRPKAEQ